MTWADRIKKASIETPDGKTYSFLYEDVSKAFRNKTARYLFSDKKSAFVSNFGVGAIDYPLKMIFSGPDYDLRAKAFDISTGLPGNCTLKHPIYGILTVVIESLRREDKLKTAANEAVYEVLMVETIVQDVPLSDGEAKSSIFSQIDKFVEDAGTVLEDAVYDVTNNSALAFAESRWNSVINTYRKAFDSIVNSTDTLREAFDTALLGISDNIETLVTKPDELASSISNAIRIPGAAPVLAQTRNAAYYTQIEDLQIPVTGETVDDKNERLELQTNLSSLLVSVCESNLLASQDGLSFVTRTDAIDAALNLLSAYNDVQEFLDNEQLSSVGADLETRFIVSDLNTQNLVNIVKTTAGNLIRLSFSLKQERIITLEQSESYIALCHKLYGTTADETLDFFSQTNELQDDEFILLPKGREIKYYI